MGASLVPVHLLAEAHMVLLVHVHRLTQQDRPGDLGIGTLTFRCPVMNSSGSRKSAGLVLPELKNIVTSSMKP